MKSRPRKVAARLFAVLSLVAFVVAFLVVLSNSGVTHNPDTTPAPTSPATQTTSTSTGSRSRFAHRRTYVVRSGDTLGAIAIKTGVSVSSLEDLNPGLDPQGLVAGQRLKLRE